MVRYVKCATDTPRVGIFWIINDEIIAVYDNINTSYDPLSADDLLHKDVWGMLKHNYLVNSTTVSYDYYPRGRVMIYPVRDRAGAFLYYDCVIYCDSCILNNPEYKDLIVNEFRLYIKSCRVSFEGKFSIDGTHYTCHNCR